MRLLKIQTLLRLSSLIILPLALLYPTTMAWAETVPADTTTSSETTAPAPAQTEHKGPTKPTGADGNTYKYNEATGLWENDHYTWNPATNQTAPKNSPNYSYNPTTNMWDTTDWRYDAPTGDYVPNVTSSSQTPAGAQSDSSPQSLSDTNKLDPNDPTSHDSTSDAAFNLFYNAQISNVISSTATSGQANVIQNTVGGSALSGDAQAIANIINMLQSSWSPSNGQIATFINTINGDVFGDIMIDPSQLPTSTIAASQAQNANLDINVQNSGQINNQINLAANSGDANVLNNTQAGNASSGSAQAIANIINMINSVIGSGQSFVGMLNINGNFNGDILMPADLINQLLASNSVPKTTISTEGSNNPLANLTNNATVNNQISTNAHSGNATVSNNTSAGNASTGNASTNITLLNLTGQQIIGKDALLVFVNVQGKWVGMIVNAPNGATSALLGNGLTTNSSSNSSIEFNGSNDMSINNDINLAAISGDATVSNNTLAGNAASGDATASVNLANILNSSFSLANWFGVFFINITGNWTGSFGVNTDAGDPAGTVNSSSTSQSSKVQIFKFVAHDNGNYGLSQIYSDNSSATKTGQNDNTKVILASAKNTVNTPIRDSFINSSSSGSAWLLPALSVVIATTLFGAERIISLRRK